MGFGFALISSQDQRQVAREVKLSEYFNKTEIEKFNILDALTSSDCFLVKNISDDKIDCDEINALSEEDFYTLIERIYELQNFCIFAGYFQDGCEVVIYKVEVVLRLIDQCRSLLPVFNKMTITLLEQMSDEQYQELESHILFQKNQMPENSAASMNVPFADPNNEYIFHPNNIEKLRAVRAEKCNQK